MITFTSGAEFHFKQILDNLGGNANQWKFYSFHISSVKRSVSQKEASKVAFNIIQNFIKEEEGAVFFFENGDIGILFHQRVQQTMDEMAYQLHYLFAENINGENTHNFMSLLDLATDYSKAKELAETKLQSTVTPQSQTQEEEPAKEHTHVLLPTQEERKMFQQSMYKKLNRTEKVILVTEDDPLSQRLVKNVLQNEYKIITATNGQETFDNYVRFAPDIVFLDIGLPDISGLQILEKLLILDPAAYIIMLSGHTYQEAIMQAMKTGARGFVGKPFTRERLIRYIQSATN